MKPRPIPTIVLATNNAHKVSEIRKILKSARLRVHLKSLADFPARRPVVENRRTIAGNAIKKACEVAKFTNCWALSDDTGLFVWALQGRPGVFSARFAGAGCTYLDNNKKLLRLLKNKKGRNRRADFRTVAALATPQGNSFWVEGRVAGRIAPTMRGRHGFGYDPIFEIPKYRKTFAEMGITLKNQISHRSRAFRKVPSLISRALKLES